MSPSLSFLEQHEDPLWTNRVDIFPHFHGAFCHMFGSKSGIYESGWFNLTWYFFGLYKSLLTGSGYLFGTEMGSNHPHSWGRLTTFFPNGFKPKPRQRQVSMVAPGATCHQRLNWRVMLHRLGRGNGVLDLWMVPWPRTDGTEDVGKSRGKWDDELP